MGAESRDQYSIYFIAPVLTAVHLYEAFMYISVYRLTLLHE
jgi:hypothetical protein